MALRVLLDSDEVMEIDPKPGGLDQGIPHKGLVDLFPPNVFVGEEA